MLCENPDGTLLYMASENETNHSQQNENTVIEIQPVHEMPTRVTDLKTKAKRCIAADVAVNVLFIPGNFSFSLMAILTDVIILRYIVKPGYTTWLRILISVVGLLKSLAAIVSTTLENSIHIYIYILGLLYIIFQVYFYYIIFRYSTLVEAQSS